MPTFEYAPAPESRAIVSVKESYGLFIGGEFTSSVDGHAFKTISPATEEVLAEVTEAGPVDVDRAVTAARKAYEQIWSLSSDSSTASRSANRATSTSRPRPRTSSTTPAGPTSSATPASARRRNRWAWPARSSRGTSRC